MIARLLPHGLFLLGCGIMVAALQLPIEAQFGLFLTACISVYAVGCAFYLRARLSTILCAGITMGFLWIALNLVSGVKAAAVMFPLTVLDIRMFAANPTGLLDSIAAPRWLYAIFDVLPIISFAGLAVIGLRQMRHWQADKIRFAGIASARIAGKLVLIAICTTFITAAVASSIRSYRDRTQQNLPMPNGEEMAAFERDIGIFGYLIYSEYLASGDDSLISLGKGANLPAQASIRQSIDKFLLADKLGSGQLPNIMIVHAESTFDINDVLKLNRHVSNDLFYSSFDIAADPQTHFHGPVLVNTIGGGSWITEFEVLHGIDTRLFGSAGRYAHTTLAGLVDFSFPRYLVGKGYEANAYTISDAVFYGAGKAYVHYGFAHYYDDKTISAPAIDTRIMAEALKIPPADDKAPFLKFIILAENHSPHECRPDAGKDEAAAWLPDPASAEQNCAVGEYVRRAASTEAAIAMGLTYLKDVQSRTGRPYVLAIYGDHQPYSFTGGGPDALNMSLDFSKFYKDPTLRKTLIKIISSKDNPIRCCWNAVPSITLFPSLVSAYVASSVNDLYLPINFYQFDKCGADWVGPPANSSATRNSAQGDQNLCPAIGPILASYRQSGVTTTPP